MITTGHSGGNLGPLSTGATNCAPPPTREAPHWRKRGPSPGDNEGRLSGRLGDRWARGMRATVTVVTTGNGRRDDVVIDAPPTTDIDVILDRLRGLVGAPPDAKATIGTTAAQAWCDGSSGATNSAPTRSLGSGLLRDGVIVTFGATPASAAAASYLELRVVAGPCSGDSYPLVMGTSSLGRGAHSRVNIDDPGISRRHAFLSVDSTGANVADAGSTNGTTIDGMQLGLSPVPLLHGMRLRMGASTLTVAGPDVAPMSVRPTVGGHLSFNRPPRLDAPDPTRARVKVVVPVEPPARGRSRLPLITTIAPLVAGVALAVIMRRPEFLLFTVLSPLMMAGQWVSDVAGHRKASRADRAAYDSAFAKASLLLASALSADEVERRHRAPDPATVAKTASAPGARLWERRRDDADFLLLNLGCGTVLADVELINGGSGTSGEPAAAPVVTRRPGHGRFGEGRRTRHRWTRPPREWPWRARSSVSSRFCTARATSLWCCSPRPNRSTIGAGYGGCPISDRSLTRRVRYWSASTPPASQRGSANWLRVVEARRTSAGGDNPRAIVIVVDGARALRRTAALADVLAGGPAVGVYAICLDDIATHLPEECGAVAEAIDSAGGASLLLAVPGVPSARDAIPDGASFAWADQLARALAPLRDDSPGRGGTLPGALRWLDIAGFGADMTADLITRWAAGSGSTRALIGIGSRLGLLRRHRTRRSACVDRRHHGLGQERVPANTDRLTRMREPARRAHVRPGRLQGRCGLRCMCRVAAHRRRCDGSRWPTRRARTCIARRRTEATGSAARNYERAEP